MCVLVAQSCPTLSDRMDWGLQGSSIHGILWARILEWVVMPSSGGSSQPGDRTCISCIVGRFFTAEPLGKLLVYFPASQLVSPCPPSPLPIPLISSLVSSPAPHPSLGLTVIENSAAMSSGSAGFSVSIY